MTTLGLDLSHYDSVLPASTTYAAGIRFVTHKAGGDKNDAELGAWWDAYKGWRGQMLLGAYWVLYPGTPSARADAFLARLDSQCPGWRDGPFILQIDAEIWGGDTSTKPTVAECNAFADRLVAKCPKLIPVGYLPKWVYGDAVASFRYPLWASSYVGGTGTPTALYPGDTSTKWGAYGGKVPTILQYSSHSIIGGDATCDANAFRGTLDQLKALLAPGWTNTVATLDDDDKQWFKDFFASATNTDGTLTSRIGRDALNQGIPNPFNDGAARTSAWRLLGDLAEAVKQIQAAGNSNGTTVDTAGIVAGVLEGLAGATAPSAQDIAKALAEELLSRLAT